MYDPVTLDQLRALVAVVEEGSFSAAARRLKRVQSAVSTSMANLEAQLGVPVWDRSTKVAKLTPAGQALLAAARRVLAEMNSLRRLSADLSAGVEPFVSLCADALFPLPALLEACAAFASAFPAVDLRVETEVMSAVSERVLAGAATLGLVSPLGIVPGLERRRLARIRVIPVVSPQHELAGFPAPIRREQLERAVQIVLSERAERGVRDQGVISARTWRVGDLHTKHMMLRAGLGWGNLPEQLVRDDLRDGRLVAIRPELAEARMHELELHAVHRADAPLGPAHRWLLERLAQLCKAREGEVESPSVKKRKGTRVVRRTIRST
jgi:DNA-binding transcriptional LysR family regulator